MDPEASICNAIQQCLVLQLPCGTIKHCHLPTVCDCSLNIKSSLDGWLAHAVGPTHLVLQEVYRLSLIGEHVWVGAH